MRKSAIEISSGKLICVVPDYVYKNWDLEKLGIVLIDDMLEVPMENPHWDFEKKVFYDRTESGA